MFATYRIELSPSQYGSEGSMTIQNSVQLPNNQLSLGAFKALILKDLEETLPRAFDTYLVTTKLREQLSQRLSEEASLFASKPFDVFITNDADAQELQTPIGSLVDPEVTASINKMLSEQDAEGSF